MHLDVLGEDSVWFQWEETKWALIAMLTTVDPSQYRQKG